MLLPLLLAPAAFAAQDVTIKAADGVSLHASAEPVKDAKRGVVLVHMNGRHAGDWRFVAEKLARSGMQAIAVDLRGHGKNVAEGADVDLEPADYMAMEHDVRAAVQWLRDAGVEQVSCAGASIGANLCLRVAANDPEIVNVALLSPGLNYKGLKTGSAIDLYGNRPMLIVASSDDNYAALSAEKLEARAAGQKHLELLTGAGHGTKMLNRDPGLEGTVLSWLLGTFELATGDVVSPQRAGNAGVDKIQTTGEKLDAHK